MNRGQSVDPQAVPNIPIAKRCRQPLGFGAAQRFSAAINVCVCHN
jgi:hypothetical protein